MATTAETLIGHAWDLLRTQGSSTDIPALQETFMLKLLSQANMEWLRAHRRGGGSGPILFMRETGVDLVSDTAINMTAGTTTATTDITVDAQTFPDDAGMALVWDDDMPDLFSYTTQTSTSFNGVTGLSFAHEDNDPIQALYKLPTNFKDFRPSETYGDGVQVNGAPYTFMEGPPTAGHFSEYDDGTNLFLWLPRSLTGSASVLYEKASAVIDDINDTTDVPEESEFFLVWRMVQIASIPKEGQPSQLYLLAKSQANLILQDSLDDKSVGAYVKVRQFPQLRPTRDSSFYQHVPR